MFFSDRIFYGEPGSTSPENALEAQVRHHLALLVLDDVRAAQALERRLGVGVAERDGPLVVGLGGVGVARAAEAAPEGDAEFSAGLGRAPLPY